MIAACPECRTQYRVDPQRLSEEGVRLRCTRCQTVFRVRAPQVDAGSFSPAPSLVPTPPATPASPGATTTPAEDGVLNPNLVLVATPDEENAKNWVETLRGWGLEAESAHDGVEAILKVHRLWPSAIVLDPQLPKMFGFQVCEVIKRNASLRQIGVVLIGAIHHPERYRRSPSELYGADFYVEEPDMPDALAPILRDLGMAIAPGQPAAVPPVAGPASPEPTLEVPTPPVPEPTLEVPTPPVPEPTLEVPTPPVPEPTLEVPTPPVPEPALEVPTPPVPEPALEVPTPPVPEPAFETLTPPVPEPMVESPTLPPPVPPDATLPPTPVAALRPEPLPSAPPPVPLGEATLPPPVQAVRDAPAPQALEPLAEEPPELHRQPEPAAALDPSVPAASPAPEAVAPVESPVAPQPLTEAVSPPEVAAPAVESVAAPPPEIELFSGPALGSPEYDVVDPEMVSPSVPEPTAPAASPEPAAPAMAEPVAAPTSAPVTPVPEPVATPEAPAASEPVATVDPEIEQAERLARIIISDVVLYNEDKFRSACEAGNVLEALEGDLADGRAHFASRIPEHIRNTRDFLADELMRLARTRGMA